MIEYPRFSAELETDSIADCRYRYIYGATDECTIHCHDYFEIFITVSGTVTHWINGSVQKLPEGSIVFIRPDDVHGYIYDSIESKKTEYINLTFKSYILNQLFSYLDDETISEDLLNRDMPPVVLLHHTEKKRLLSQISELNAVNWEDKKALKLRMKVILTDIFARSFFRLSDMPKNTAPLWLSKLLSDMEYPKNFTQGIDCMITLSKKSREHLARSLKKYYGTTITEYINELRINYASNLLINTNTPVLDICFECGFSSVSYFYKIFKNFYHLSPTEFRKQYSKNDA